MKINNRSRSIRRFAWLALTLLLSVVRARALDVVDPTGTTYTSVSDSSDYSSSYAGPFLFNFDLTGVPVGSVLPSAAGDWATAGQATAYLAFQVAQVYTNVGSIFYAQRAGGNPVLDKINTISIWASATTAFSPTNPGTPPNSVVVINNQSGHVWDEYLMTNSSPISGQYFLIEVAQNSAPTAEGNPGGGQFRLGANLGIPPSILTPPVNISVYSNGTCRFPADALGSTPLTYTWSFGGSTLTNGGRFSGANTADLVISGITSGDVGVYTLSVSNSFGSTNVTASLALAPSPTNAANLAVISRGPLAYWQLNEPSGATMAFDYVGSFNGTYGSTSISGVAGPQPPAFPGFSKNNTGLQTTGYDLNSPATVPALNISTNDSVSILAWINPTQQSDQAAGDQEPYTGIVFWRNVAFGAAGLIFDGGGTNLGYQWDGNRFQFESGLTPPIGQWSMVAMVYTSNSTTLYMGSSNGLVLSAVDNTPEPGQPFNSPMTIGIDTDVGESTRTFNGEISDVAFFNRALTSGDLSAIYAAATGINPVLRITGESATNIAVTLGEPTTLSVQTSGLAPQYQWYERGAPIASATDNTLTISDTLASQSGNYYVVVTNIYGGSITSAVISLMVSNIVVLPIGPSGVIYSNISDSSEYSGQYAGSNLFNEDVTGISLGSVLTGGQWATAGQATAFLAFQVDQVYSNVGSIFYAQRAGGNPVLDKINTISIWASTTTPFSTNDPGTPPNSVVQITDQSGAQWEEYLLTNQISGQYFLIEIAQNSAPTADGNPGGTQFRLGGAFTPELTYSSSAAGLTLYWPMGVVVTLQQAPTISGPWTSATGITNGVAIPLPALRNQQTFYRIKY